MTIMDKLKLHRAIRDRIKDLTDMKGEFSRELRMRDDNGRDSDGEREVVMTTRARIEELQWVLKDLAES